MRVESAVLDPRKLTYPQQYDIQTDTYHNGVNRLDLFEWDGTPMMPLYFVQSQPLMLPTTTLHPTNTPTGKNQQASATGSNKAKRGLADEGFPINFKTMKVNPPQVSGYADAWWWVGAVMTGVGGVLYFCV
jgi:hypothetical protein